MSTGTKDIHHLEEARRLRDAELDRILRAIGRALARLAGKKPSRPGSGHRPGPELP